MQNNTAVQGQVGPVINMVGGLLSMADTIVQFNSAFAFGTISIYSASLLVRGGEFKHNTITGSGSCLYLAAADSSSVLNTTVSAGKFPPHCCGIIIHLFHVSIVC